MVVAEVDSGTVAVAVAVDSGTVAVAAEVDSGTVVAGVVEAHVGSNVM